MHNTFHWHVMLGDHYSIPAVSLEYTDLYEAVDKFVDLVYAIMPTNYGSIPRLQSLENLTDFMIGNFDQNVGAQAGDFKIVLGPCDGCFNPTLN